MTAAKLDPVLCRRLSDIAREDHRLLPAFAEQLTSAAEVGTRVEELEDAMCTAIDALTVGIPAGEVIERLQVVLDDDDRKPAAGKQVPGVSVVGIGPADTVLLVEALDLWNRYLTAPHADIARIRALLCGPAPGSAPMQDGGGS